jgi:hypothetical protein
LFLFFYAGHQHIDLILKQSFVVQQFSFVTGSIGENQNVEILDFAHSRIPNRTKLSPYFFCRTVRNVAVPVVLPIEGIGSAEEAFLLDLNFIEAILDYHINYGHQGSNDRYDVYDGRNTYFNKRVY